MTERRKRRNTKSHENTVSEIGHSASELSQTAEQLAHNILQQSQTTTSIAAAVTEITHSIEEISKRINRVYDSAKDSHELSLEGGKSIIDVHRNMDEVVVFIKATQKHLSELDTRMLNVSSISTVIREISAQTNLLALNAAIEAARAGEHGRGFAVVAEEVRALANRSHNSAEEITANIEGVQSNMLSVNSSMKGVINKADETVSVTNTAHTLFNDIADNVLSVTETLNAVADASDQQAIAVREISENIEGISVVAAENSRMAKRTSTISSYLYQLCRPGESNNTPTDKGSTFAEATP